MTATTIKVSVETRDRLKTQAAAARISLGEHLSRLADAADRQDRLAAARQAMGTASPSVLAYYEAETRSWEAADSASGG